MNKLRVSLGLIVSLGLGMVLAAPCQAQSSGDGSVGGWPKIGSETAVNLEYDHLAPSHMPTGDALNIQIQHQTLVEFDNRWSLSNLLTLEPGDDLESGKHTVLSNHELYAEELFGRWNNEQVNIRFGKFAQNFARAWYLVPGLYGQDFVSDYALGETIGIDGQIDLGPPKWGLHQLSVSAFMADRTILSESLLHNRGRVTLDDGGPSNTRGLESYVASYDASNVPVGRAALNYQVSYASLGAGRGADGREDRYSAGFDVNAPLFGGTVADTLRGHFRELRVIAEAVRVDRADGIDGQRRDYVTGALEYVTGQWVFDLTATDRWSRDDTFAVTHDTLRSVAIGYSLPSDTVVAIGAAQERVGGVNSLFAGISFSQTLTICDRCLIRGRHY